MANTRLPIVLHLPPEEIAYRYRTCRTGVEKTHWQVLWLLTRPDQPLSPARAAEQVGLTPVWVRALLRRWNAEGPAGLADRRKGSNGGRSKLSTERQIDLWDALQHTPPDGGLWTGPKVAAYVRDRWGIEVCPQTGWGWLHGLGFSLQAPRPSHPEAATPAARRAWKRGPGRPTRPVAPPASREGRRALGRG
jgi:transposase